MKFLVVSLLFASTSLLPATPPAATGNGDLDIARRLESAFVKVAEQASQSVVVIRCKQMASPATAANPEPRFEGSPLEEFFKRRGLPLPPPKEYDSEGSGIILRADGFILTNNHVVDGAEKIQVRLRDGRELAAKLVGADDRTDVAVIKVEARDLVAARLGDSAAVKVGQWAIAIGAPFELEYSFTVGFVSAKGRSALFNRTGSAYEDYIQTDASINPGNSGGPLCDIEGRVIGINTLIRGLNRGIGFAIPIDMAKGVAEQLIDRGRVVRPWLGIGIEALAENKELQELTQRQQGVIVKEIQPDTPAAASELKPADVILAVDEVPVSTPRELQQQILAKKIGQTVRLEVARGEKTLTVSVLTAEMKPRLALAALPSTPAEDFAAKFGFTVQELTKELAAELEIEAGAGVVVTAVDEESPADRRGLMEGDLIIEINRQAVVSLAQFRAAMAKANPNKGLLLYIKRGDSSTFVVLKDK